jgi:hypothetical protein
MKRKSNKEQHLIELLIVYFEFSVFFGINLYFFKFKSVLHFNFCRFLPNALALTLEIHLNCLQK